MFYQPGVTEHGLPYDPFKVFSSNQTSSGVCKDTMVNAKETGAFVWNLAIWDLHKTVNITTKQTPYGTDKSELCQTLIKEQVKFIGVPMVKESPVKFTM